jgi:hypothetical protein
LAGDGYEVGELMTWEGRIFLFISKTYNVWWLLDDITVKKIKKIRN